MVIRIKVSFREYVKLLYNLTYRRPIMIVIVGVGFAMLLWIAGYYGHFLPVPEPSFYQYTPLVLIGIAQPLVIYRTVWKNYHSSCQLKEAMTIEFTDEEIKMTGETFFTVLIWLKIYKVMELKNWFLIYQNNLSAIIIPKKTFSKEQIREFKNLLRRIPGIPMHLKTA